MMNIESLNLVWSEPKEINTRRGIRTLRTASPDANFWGAWKRSKSELQSLGIAPNKTRSGDWEICHWKDEAAEITQTILDGAATNRNEGLSSPATPVISTGAVVVAWSDEQEAIFEWFRTGKGHLVVKARAGTGKTTTIKHAFSVAPEGKMLYAVFNKKNQVEAEGKISDPRVEVKTLHSLGFSYISAIWRGVKPDDAVEAERIQAVEADGVPEEPAGAIERLVGFAKNTFLGTPNIAELEALANERGIFSAMEDEEINSWNVTRLAYVAKAAMEYAKCKSDRISFNDMVWLPVALNIVKPRFDLVCVDEAQDMNLPQLEMAIRSCNVNGRICIVGDDRQAIYGFRGAASDGMELMRQRLGANTLGLTTTYRCPKAVVRIAAEIVVDYRAAQEAPEGIVLNLGYDEIAPVVGDAILSRLNAPLMSLCLQLLRKGTPARIEGRDIGRQLVGMVRKLRAKSVPDFLRKLNAWGDKQCKRLNCGKNAEAKVAMIQDQVATLTAVSEDASSVFDIEARINSLFQDSDKATRPAVVLSSVHKAKGLEWNKVFILSATFKKNRGQEEANIFYVAVTRAKQCLTFVE